MGTIRLIGENEVVRKPERRGRRRGRGESRFLGRVRGVFAFLLVATVFIFAFCHRADMQNYVISHLYRWSRAELKSDPLRQSALNHENEVNRVAQ